MTILRLNHIIIIAIVTIWSTTVSAISIKPSVEAKSLTVGDKFVYKNELPAGSEMEALALAGKLGDAVVLSPIYRMKNSKSNAETYACTLAVYQPGPTKIPTFTFRAANSSDTALVIGDTLTVNIASVLPPDTTGLQMADIRGPKRLLGPIWIYLLAPIVVALVAFAIYWLIRRFRKRRLAPAVPPIPPWEAAFKRLDWLKSQRHLDFGRFKQYYFELSLIVRTYIEELFETLAVESTTHEIKNDAKVRELPSDLYERLFELFDRADLAKFAKSIPTIKEAESDLAFAYDFVVRTKPASIEHEEKAVEEVKA